MITGTTGKYEHKLNGVYELTEEISNGLPVYKKKVRTKGDRSMSLRYEDGCWMAIEKSNDLICCVATYVADRPCLPQDSSEVKLSDSTSADCVQLCTTLLSEVPSSVKDAVSKEQERFDDEVQ